MTALIATAVTSLGAVLTFVVFLMSRKHKERVEDSGAETNHVTAISAASETLAEAVNILIQPLNDSIAALQEREREQARQIAEMRLEIATLKADRRQMHSDFASMVRYIRELWKHIQDNGGRPPPTPADLIHVLREDEAGDYDGI
jgi:hypothetical protein